MRAVLLLPLLVLLLGAILATPSDDHEDVIRSICAEHPEPSYDECVQFLRSIPFGRYDDEPRPQCRTVH